MSTEAAHIHWIARLGAGLDDAGWCNFAARHGLTVFWHTHGALRGAHGEIDGLRVSVCGRLDGVELIGSGALPASFGFVLCDGSFAEWCLEPSRVEVAEEGHARAVKAAHLPPVSPAALAYLLPHRYVGAAAGSGDPALDERYRALAQNEPRHLHLAPPAVQALLRLPSPARVAAVAGDFRAFFPGVPLSDELLDVFHAAWRALGRV